MNFCEVVTGEIEKTTDVFYLKKEKKVKKAIQKCSKNNIEQTKV